MRLLSLKFVNEFLRFKAKDHKVILLFFGLCGINIGLIGWVITSPTLKRSPTQSEASPFTLAISTLDRACQNTTTPQAQLVRAGEIVPLNRLLPLTASGILSFIDQQATNRVQPNCTTFLPNNGTAPNTAIAWRTVPQAQTLARQHQQWQTAIAQLPDPHPWPQIHPNAQLAQVPILMYHDILPKKEVFFDVTPQELEAHFQRIHSAGMTPISLEQLITHLRTGHPLPEKPILLTFDDGYGGHYHYVYPLLKKYSYPAVISIYTQKMEMKTGRSSVTWDQLKEMATDPLITIASHSISHPNDLTVLSDEQLQQEIIQSKQILENRLGTSIRYFTYPVGKFDDRVKHWVTKAGYWAALSMDDANELFAGESEDVLAIGRFGQSSLERIIPQAWGGPPLPRTDGGFNFATTIRKQELTLKGTEIILLTGGRPSTFHAAHRSQLTEMLEGTRITAAVDGAFFSLKTWDTNAVIGPILSHNRGFIPADIKDITRLQGRPLVLIGPNQVQFIPFNRNTHNTLNGITAELPSITDAFVGAAWLVKNSEPQPAEAFGNLLDFDAARNRAFWGINQAGQPIVGVTVNLIDSVALGNILAQAGFRDAVMLDSGASTSLAYNGESLVKNYVPRPVPHAVVLISPELNRLSAR